MTVQRFFLLVHSICICRLKYLNAISEDTFIISCSIVFLLEAIISTSKEFTKNQEKSIKNQERIIKLLKKER